MTISHYFRLTNSVVITIYYFKYYLNSANYYYIKIKQGRAHREFSRPSLVVGRRDSACTCGVTRAEIALKIRAIGARGGELSENHGFWLAKSHCAGVKKVAKKCHELNSLPRKVNRIWDVSKCSSCFFLA